MRNIDIHDSIPPDLAFLNKYFALNLGWFFMYKICRESP